MKKTLASVLTTALVVGAASTTFAAANPFSDVPAGHWAYDAVAQLAADGVIEGYGDGTFRGDQSITRYEMAQMIAKAMAKNPSGVDKAMLDRLAAEFREELNNLGVRVSNLEKHADMVQWKGKLEYTYRNDRRKFDDGGRDTIKRNSNTLTFRLEPKAEVNDHWTVNARIDGTYNMQADNDGSGGNDVDVRLKRAWAQGDYKNFSVRFGKFSMYGDEDINDTTMSGIDATIGNKDGFSGTLGGGRTAGAFTDNALLVKYDEIYGTNYSKQFAGIFSDDAANVAYAGIDYNRNENKGLFGGVRYFRYTNAASSELGDKRDNIWQVRLGYNFDRSSVLRAFYAHGSGPDVDRYDSKEKRSYAVEYDYKGAKADKKGSWGAWIAYRHLGAYATPAGTWDVNHREFKGFEVGANYTFVKNIIGTLRYGHNKRISDRYTDFSKSNEFFGRVEFLF